jgi:hypothetical protein
MFRAFHQSGLDDVMRQTSSAQSSKQIVAKVKPATRLWIEEDPSRLSVGPCAASLLLPVADMHSLRSTTD